MRQEGGKSYHVTLICVTCANAGEEPKRETPRPTLVLPGERLPKSATLDSEKDVQLLWNWAGSETGWISQKIWKSWVTDVFCPWVTAYRATLDPPPTNDRVLLWTDQHDTRKELESLSTLEQFGVDLVCLPAHTTHILQPLDCGIFRVLKRRLREVYQQLASKHEQVKGTVIYRQLLLKAAHSAVHVAMDPYVVETAWKVTGLYPFNPDYVLSDPNKVHTGETSKPAGLSQDIQGRVLTVEVLLDLRSKREEAAQQKVQEKNQKKEAAKMERERKKQEKIALRNARQATSSAQAAQRKKSSRKGKPTSAATPRSRAKDLKIARHPSAVKSSGISRFLSSLKGRRSAQQ